MQTTYMVNSGKITHEVVNTQIVAENIPSKLRIQNAAVRADTSRNLQQHRK
jgi:hypothetical protein